MGPKDALDGQNTAISSRILNKGFPYPVRALRVRLLVAPGGPGMAYGFLPLLGGHFSHRPPVHPKDPTPLIRSCETKSLRRGKLAGDF